MDNTSLVVEQVIFQLATLSILSFFLWQLSKKLISYVFIKHKRRKLRNYNLEEYNIASTYRGEIRCLQKKENPNKLIYI